MVEPSAKDVVWPTLVAMIARPARRTGAPPSIPCSRMVQGTQHQKLTEQMALVNEHWRFLYDTCKDFEGNESGRAAINEK